MSTNLRVRRVTGSEMEQYIPDLAQLRIEIFRDFPYLYDGSQDYEEKYLKTYIDSPGSVIVLAQDGEKIIGASTGMPMKNETDAIKHPFIEHNYSIDRVFYFAESVLRKSYRGHGIGVQFFEQREAHVASLSNYDYTCFCGVVRPDDHPMRPGNYASLHTFWMKRGYTRHPELRTQFSWLDINDTAETDKTMEFWLKST